MMPLPTVDQYNDAVQTPRIAFTDSDLRGAQANTNAFGIPQALGGGFALTYTFTGAAGQKWAVRCFHKAVAGLGDRYAHIHQTLNRLRSPYFVDFAYQPEGIRVNGAVYPIVKMAWVDGETLGSHLDRVYHDKARILTLRQQFRQLEGFLRGQQIAHGDLQNGNVMVGHDVRLIDYDGLYVPNLPTGRGTELGHKHFQHPRRQASDHGPALDRFAFISIDLALSAVAEQPALFKQFSNGENILFTANDYIDPDGSAVFQALRAFPTLKPDVERFAQVCLGSVAGIPVLADFLKPTARRVPVTARAARPVAARGRYLGAFEVLDGRDFARGLAFVGQRVELIGKITEIRESRTQTRTPKPYVFINFGHWRGKILKIAIWSEGLEHLVEADRPTGQWWGRWISVTGLLDPPYSNSRFNYTHLSVTVAESNQMRLITEEEARWRLASIGQPPPDLLPVPVISPAPRPATKPESKPEPDPNQEPKPKPIPPKPHPSSTSAPPTAAEVDVQRRNAEIKETLAKLRTPAIHQPVLISAPPIKPESQPAPPRSIPPTPCPGSTPIPVQTPRTTPPTLSPQPASAPTLRQISPLASIAQATTVQPTPVTLTPIVDPEPYINRSYPLQSPSEPSRLVVPWFIGIGIGVFLIWLFSANSCTEHSTPVAQSDHLATTNTPPTVLSVPTPSITSQTAVPTRNPAQKRNPVIRTAPRKPASTRRTTKRPTPPNKPETIDLIQNPTLETQHERL